MKALYCAIDALLWAVAFTPIAIYRQLGKLQRCIREGKYWQVLCVPLIILFAPLFLLMVYAQAKVQVTVRQ